MSAADKIKMIDANGDGVLTAEEHAKASADMFAKMDTDKDGFLSNKEMAAGHASRKSRQSRAVGVRSAGPDTGVVAAAETSSISF